MDETLTRSATGRTARGGSAKWDGECEGRTKLRESGREIRRNADAFRYGKAGGRKLLSGSPAVVPLDAEGFVEVGGEF